MKNKLDDNYLRTIYSSINYVIIVNKNDSKQYIASSIDNHHLKYTYFLNKAMKFYKYEDAIFFINKHHLKCYKICEVEFTTKLIKEK